MHLWNDYEGTTLAGRWQLGRLLRTEGRSALFSTTQSDGKPAVLRLTEALNDQAVLHARFRAIQTAGDQYLVGIQGYGDAVLDGTPLSYAVLEPTQESLADILAQRRLAPDETMEVANSVAGGLLALHAQGLVHGLVEPESVLAAGDRIKLRSDCARPAPAPEDAALEGAVTPQTDAFGLADVLCRSLTQNRLQDASDALALPEPFATIVRNTARGAWGVPEIRAELDRYGRARTPAAPVMPAAAAAASPVESLEAASPLERGETPAAPAPPSVRVPEPVQASSFGEPAQPLSSRASAAGPAALADEDERPRAGTLAGNRGILLAVGAAVLLLLLFLLFHHSPAKPAAQQAIAIPAVSPSTLAPAVTPSITAAPAAPHAARHTPVTAPAAPLPRATSPLAGEKVWRVIVYTYNHRSEAAAKAAAVNQRYPGFDAQVWSRTGERPFLVTLGAGMTEQQAFALRARARTAGLAHDLYAQNYSH